MSLQSGFANALRCSSRVCIESASCLEYPIPDLSDRGIHSLGLCTTVSNVEENESRRYAEICPIYIEISSNHRISTTRHSTSTEASSMLVLSHFVLHELLRRDTRVTWNSLVPAHGIVLYIALDSHDTASDMGLPWFRPVCVSTYF